MILVSRPVGYYDQRIKKTDEITSTGDFKFFFIDEDAEFELEDDLEKY